MREVLLFTQSQALCSHWIGAIDDSYQKVMQETQLYEAFDESKKQIVLFDLQSFSELFDSVMSRAKSLKIALFALTGNPTFKEGSELLTQGISGFGNSYMAAGNLRLALDVISSGDVWLYPEFIQNLIAEASQKVIPVKPEVSLDLLTPKELEVAQNVALGMTNKEVAIKLSITERTTKAHLTHIYEKLNISDRLTLALMFKAS